MRKHRISADEAQAIMKGRVNSARPDLDALAESIAGYRAAAFATTVRPSAELAARLDLERATSFSMSSVPTSIDDSADSRAAATVEVGSHAGGVKRMISWFVGLGLASKIALGAGIAVAATTGAGAVGVLPESAQDAFNGVVSVVSPWSESDETVSTEGETTTDESVTDESVTDEESGTFGESVSERAKLLGEDGDGKQFGADVSDEAQQIGDEKRQGAGAPAGDETTDDSEAADGSNVGSTHKPTDVPPAKSGR